MNERIQILIDKLNTSPSKFADDIGVPRSTISHLVSGRNKPSLDFVTKVVGRFKNVNLDWLMFGKGNILNSEEDMGKQEGSMKIEDKGKIDRIEETNLFSGLENIQENQTNLSEKGLSDSEKKDSLKTDKDKVLESEETTKQESADPEKKIIISDDSIEKIVLLYKDKTFTEYTKR